MDLERFHPLVAEWFSHRFAAPTAPQSGGWSHIADGRDTLIAAPTGSGKTLAAFLWSIDQLVRNGAQGCLPDETLVVYVSPLKALGNDVQRNLTQPLAEIQALAAERGAALPDVRVAVRSGDTPSSERARMLRRPPHILITTPESLYILLTAEGSRAFLRTTQAVIVDEIHAVAADKRGSHLALSLERLDMLAGRRVQRIGLSATQKPITDIARLLVGAGRCHDGEPQCAIVDAGHRRDWELTVEVGGQPLGPIPTHELRGEVLDRIAQLAGQHRSTLVFVNTRRMVERISHELTTRLGEGKVAAHHGSLSRKIRLQAERGLKSGEIPVVVATASLELGIDIGHVDLVCHLGAPRSLATMLQRVGRSGHAIEGTPKGILFPLTRDELMQCAAAVRAARAGELDRVVIPSDALDVLAQQIVAICASDKVGTDELFDAVRRAWPYRQLDRCEYDQVVEMLAEGVATRQGRRSAHIHHDQVNQVLKGRRGARLAAITSGGAIPDVADYDVIAEPDETFVGKVNEDFAIESMAGDIFLLGNASWRIRRIEAGRVRVTDAQGAPPTVPFWVGEAPARTPELSEAVAALRELVASGLHDHEVTIGRLVAETGVDRAGAEQLVAYVMETVAVLGTVPTTGRIVAERFFDEAGGMQLVVHAPFGARVNRALGLALRKRFCVSFDFELQAAATDDGVVLSLGEQHSFPLESVFHFVRTATMRDDLVQSALASPMFGTRWRWNATRALALLRHQGGRRVPMPIQRMRADDLLSAVFPEQVACQEERMGPIVPPDHPLVNETVRNCLHEVMDLDGAASIVAAIEAGELQTVAVETPQPSAMSHEILNANPYAFLDDAPLEERRARAVALRRTDPDLARGVGALDADAIAEVAGQAWPDVRDADELHDHLLGLVVLPVEDTEGWGSFADELVAAGRATVASWPDPGGAGRRAYVATERLATAQAFLPDATFDPAVGSVGGVRLDPPQRDEALRAAVHGWVQSVCPVTTTGLAERLGVATGDVEVALASLEASGVVLRGRFTPGAEQEQWCERRLLARIHRRTIQTLRREIEPVTAAQLVRFLLRWQHVQPGRQLHGRDGLVQVIGQLQGYELPAPAWEAHVLPSRLQRYDPQDLEQLCLSGVVAWGRLTGSTEGEAGHADDDAPVPRRQVPTRNTPIAFLVRDDVPVIATPRAERDLRQHTPAAQEVARFLGERGASFLADIAKGTGRMPAEIEAALWELVSGGLVTGDGVAGLRHLLGNGSAARRRQPTSRRPALHAVAGGRRPTSGRHLPVGRWALWRTDIAVIDPADRNETLAWQLLRRYGVVFRDLVVRERHLPPWRVLVDVYRRLEATQQIRGGRFVSGFVGEQFALPQAVDALRAVRRSPDDTDVVIVSCADPLNLVGVVLPGPRISTLSGQAIAYRNGTAVDIGPLGALRSRLRSSGTSRAGA